MTSPFGFEKLEYTPGWYYSKWPGFLNLECYQLLSDFSNGKYPKRKIRRRTTITKKRKNDTNGSQQEQTQQQTATEKHPILLRDGVGDKLHDETTDRSTDGNVSPNRVRENVLSTPEDVS